MPRPAGWKPHSYTTIAQICGRLMLGHGIPAVEAEYGVSFHTVRHLAKVLREMGALVPQQINRLSPEQDGDIWRMIKTTRLTNHEIRKRVGLTSSAAVRQRRVKYHADLRSRGLPVPLCECGDEFQHIHRCRVMPRCPKPLSGTDRPELIAELVRGANISSLAVQYGVGRIRIERLMRQMSKAQRAKRHSAITARRSVAGRRTAASTNSADLLARLEAIVPHGLPADVRSEAIQEMALQILDGQLSESEAVLRLKSFTSKAFRQFGDPWGTVSLDADQDGMTLADRIEDESALEAFEELDDPDSDFIPNIPAMRKGI